MALDVTIHIFGGLESAAVDNDASPKAEAPATPADEQIRMRAYEIYCERGGRVGDDMSDWLRAEREYHDTAASERG